MNKYEKAVDACLKAIQIDPINSSHYYNLGNVLSKAKRYDQAILNYRKAIQIDPKNSMAHRNLGYAFS